MTRKLIYPIVFLTFVMVLSSCAVNRLGTGQPMTGQDGSTSTPTLVLATPYASEPAAGICQAFEGTVVRIKINEDMPDPRCAKVRSDQTLSVVDNTPSPIRVSIGSFSAILQPGVERSYLVPFGDYLAPGVHQLSVTPYFGAELWLEASK